MQELQQQQGDGTYIVPEGCYLSIFAYRRTVSVTEKG